MGRCARLRGVKAKCLSQPQKTHETPHHRRRRLHRLLSPRASRKIPLTDVPFARILRSSALMGGAQVVSLAAGFVRAKVVAMVFGASGIGLIGVLNSFSGNISSFVAWGLSASGVRVIAGASEAERPVRVSAVRYLGRWLSWLGLAVALILFWPMGRVTLLRMNIRLNSL